MTENIAVAHRSFAVNGGGEKVAQELARTFEAPLFTGTLNGISPEPNVAVGELWNGYFKRLIELNPPLSGILKMHGWAQADELTDFDTILTSGPEPLWYMPTDEQTIIAYCHSPMRWLYDRHHETSDSVPGTLFKTAKRLLYESATNRPDHWIANSQLIKRRLEQYLNIPKEKITVVYPPVETETYGHDRAQTQEYYLYLGRLCEGKRVNSLVNAFNDRDETLIIAGDGPEKDTLEANAPGNVIFEGRVSEHRKRVLYANAKALLYPPVNEDFGMVPIEAIASGTPVIGVNEGFTRHQILDGRNGYIYDHPNVAEALDRFEENGVAWSESELENFARQHFNRNRFQAQIRATVDMVETQSEVSVPWSES